MIPLWVAESKSPAWGMIYNPGLDERDLEPDACESVENDDVSSCRANGC